MQGRGKEKFTPSPFHPITLSPLPPFPFLTLLHYNATMKNVLFLTILLFILVGCSGVGEATLTGQVIFVEIDGRDQHVTEYDLATGRTKRLFTAPENAWVSGTAVSPNRTQIIMAYAPEPPPGKIQLGYTGLFSLSEGSEPTEYLLRDLAEEVLYNPVWSPDEQYLYYSHVIPDAENSMIFTNQLERLHVETGEVEVVAANGIWPRVSPDGNRVAYVTINPDTLANALFMADADGENAELLIPEDRFQVIDVPIFSPDGEWLYFSASEQSGVSRTWWEILLGIEVVAAHNIPSDWWRMLAAGGNLERLTNRDEIGLYGEISTDGETVLFVSTTGLYRMNADGTGIEQLLETRAAPSLSWVNR